MVTTPPISAAKVPVMAVRVWRSPVLVLATALSVAWGGGVDRAQAAPASPADAKPVAAPVSGVGSGPLAVGADGLVSQVTVTRPNMVSAAVTARSTNAPVEVLGQRTEQRRVWVFPDGHVQEEDAAGPVRFKDPQATDGWRTIDTTLRANPDGSASAVAVPGGLSVGGDQVVSQVDAAGGKVALALPGVTLPTPRLDGSTATFPDVFAGVDVQVESRANGFQLVWKVRDAAGAAELVKRFGANGTVQLPLTATGTGLDAAGASDQVQFTDAKGHAHGRLRTPLVWDAKNAAHDGTGTPGKGAWKLGKPSRVGRRSQTGLQVGVSSAWLSDSARVFPVTIDPTYVNASTSPVFDTFVQQGYGTDQSGSTELKLGNNGSGQVARSYLNFDASVFKGKAIKSATLSMYENYSWSCTARGWSDYDAGLASSSTLWTAQPTAGTKRASTTQTLGYSSSCAAGRVNMDMTGQAQAWSTASTAQVGMMLRADDETDSYGWKRFSSSEGANKPVIQFSYDRAPGTPAAPGITSATQVAGRTYTGSLTPQVRAVVPADADGNTMKMQVGLFTSATGIDPFTSECLSGYNASGTSVPCNLPTLTDNSHAWLRTRAWDGTVWGPWSAATEFYVATATPPAPSITCDATANGGWQQVSKAQMCYVTATAVAASSNSAATSIRWTRDGSAATTTGITQPSTSSPQKIGFGVGGTDGWHKVTAVAVSPTGAQSAVVSYTFGSGSAALSTPKAGMTTTGAVQVTAAAPPATNGATVTSQVQWRMLGSADANWTNAPASNTFTTTATAQSVAVSGLFDTNSIVGQRDHNNDATGAGPVAARTPSSVQLRVCVTYTGSATPQCTPARTIVRVPHAFGAGFPTADAGPGKVALWTGELQLSESDADLPTGGGSVQVGRTHTSFAGDVAPAQAVFGPGWVADLAAGDDDAGLSGAQVLDSTSLDGTIDVLTADGDTLVYAAPGQRTGTGFATGTYTPVDDDTATSGITLTVTQASATAAPALTFTDDSGMQTLFQATAPSGRTPVVFTAGSVIDKATGTRNTYVWQNGLVSQIMAANPGVTCTVGQKQAGCRMLQFVYDQNHLLTQINAQIDTEASTRTLSSYTYNPDHTMATQTDTVTGLTTSYAWAKQADGTYRLTGLTPPGEDGYTFTYANNKLSQVTRPLPSSVQGSDRTAQLAAFVYNQPTSVSDFNLGQFTNYQLPRTATQAFAVFGPDQKITSAPIANDPSWHRAEVYLTDDQGYTIHDGSYGAGAWQLDANVYDEHDNVVQSWDDRATQQLRDGGMSDIAAASTLTTYNPDWTNASGAVVTPAGSVVTSQMGPARWLTDKAGNRVWARTVTDTSYDNDNHALINPDTNQPYRLTTKVVTRTLVQDTSNQQWTNHDTVGTVLTSYDGTAVDDSSVTGWKLGQPTAVTTDMDGSGTVTTGDITKQSVYDKYGDLVQQRQPSAAGKTTDPGTHQSVYYTAGTNPTVASCGNHPEWAGMICQVGPGSGTLLPTDTTTGYTWDLQPTTVVRSNAGATITTATSYTAQMRPQTVTTSSSGLTGSVKVPAVTTSYDTWGRVTGTSSTDGTTATSYDSWGRTVSYTNTPAGTTGDTQTTTYDALGQVVKTSNNQTTSSYTYDGTDANNNPETRGLVTSVTATQGSSSWTAHAAYDAQGSLTLEKLPAGITRRHDYDPAGEQTGLSYTGDAVDPDTGKITADQSWFGWSTETDAAGRTVHQWNPDGGNIFDTTNAARADRTYTYDPAGRLTKVDDTTQANDGTTSCQRRGYTFDANGNRTQQSSATNPTSCSDTGATTITRTYDAADRPTTANGGASYVYDQMGRQTLIPAADTQAGASGGDATLSYTDADDVATLNQGAVGQSYTYDGAQRRLDQITRTNGTITSTLTRHYTDTSDNPAWSTNTTNGHTTTSNYLGLIDTGLGLTTTITDGGTPVAELELTDPQGNINATTTIPTTGNAQGIDTWNTYTEYGIPETTPAMAGGTGSIGYGWLGQHERSTLTTGFMLMGARIYNQTTGQFTSVDSLYGGNDTAYDYPTDPINSNDTSGLFGCGFCHRAGSYIWKHRSTIAGAVATGACFAGGIFVCGAAQLGAYEIRSQQYASSHGGFSRSRRHIAADGLGTVASFGMGSAFKYAKYGKSTRLFFRGRQYYTRSYREFTGMRNIRGARAIARQVVRRPAAWARHLGYGAVSSIGNYGFGRARASAY